MMRLVDAFGKIYHATQKNSINLSVIGDLLGRRSAGPGNFVTSHDIFEVCLLVGAPLGVQNQS